MNPIGILVVILLGVSAIIGVTFILFRSKYGIFNKAYVTQGKILDSFDDGVIVINQKDQIVYLNTAAEKIIGITFKSAYGEPIESFLTNWNSLSQNTKTREFEYKGSVNFNGKWRYFNIRLSTLQNSKGEDIAKTIILRDTTDQRNVTELRQRTRDEMFVFLRSLFNSISTSKNEDELFQNALFQIAYTFNIQHGAFFLVETSLSKSPKYTLAAKFGTLMQKGDTLSRLHSTLDVFNWMNENKQPLLILDGKQDPRLVEFSQDSEFLSIACFPLLFRDQILGVLIFARTRAPGFSSDEITRLNVVSDELASFLNTEKNKKTEIALTERQRLIRDLHDSITQKLYGMVTLTEAIQIGLETGAIQNTSDQMARISENARQALREMRLFLYELEPVDLEREGLVSVIQQRIASVEGRSGIRARLLCDNEISLSAEKERALYYILQEALNNILKHTQAKSILVKLKQRKHSIYLEINDDGSGFDPKNIERGGLGIQNMYARAEQIGGKLKITSSINHGTKISVTVPQ